MPAQKKIDKDREKDKSYDFVFVLYPENETHTLAYLKLTSYQYNALVLLHDKDTYVDDEFDEETGELIHKAGDLKKEHYHVYVKFRNRRYIGGVAEEIGIEPHLIQFCEHGFKAYAEYMLHWGKHATAGRYIYEIDNFEGTLKSAAREKLSSEDKSLSLFRVYQFIKDSGKYLTMSDVYEWCFSQGYSSIYASKRAHIRDWIDDKNSKMFKRL